MAGTPTSLEGWVAMLGTARLPVLGCSVEALARLLEREDDVVARDISNVILRDPMLTLSVLIVLQTKRPSRRIVDITTIEHAIMMMGVSPFFRQFDGLPVVEDLLATNPVALRGFMAVAVRARRAALHAKAWAASRCDIESDEVVIAALLHDMAELLIWFFAPRLALEIADRKLADPTLRSAVVQRAVLGFPLSELQSALCREWQMPDLLQSLMEEQHGHRPRARNALLAVSLARHSEHGWRDAALPHDLIEIGELLGLPCDEVGKNIYRTELLVIADLQQYGARADAVWLPPLPQILSRYSAWLRRSPHEADPMVLEHALDYLSAPAAEAQWLIATPERSGATIQNIARIDAIAVAMNGINTGLGLDRVLLLDVDDSGMELVPRYVVGGQGTGKLRDLSIKAGNDPGLGEKLLGLRESGDLLQLREQPPSSLAEAVGDWNSAREFVAMPLLTGPPGRWSLIYADGCPSEVYPDNKILEQFRNIVLAVEGRLVSF